MPELAVEVRDLTKRYRNGVLANDAIDLEIEAGTIFGLLGPNGAGKSTLVRQLTAQLAPTSGSIQVHGVDVLRQPLAAKRLMGVVPQEAEPWDFLTIGDHLLNFGRLHGLSREAARERAAALIDTLALGEHAAKFSVHLSGGLKRKLLVAIALVAEPRVLVLDEPTTGLDPRSRREVWSLIGDLKSRGTTVLLTTHYMDEAEALCDQVAIIGSGRILAEGTIDDLRARCRTRFKATYEVEGRPQFILGQTRPEVLAAIEARGVAEFSVMRTSLEDVFLELTEQPVGA
jgi:ABC-2 type transport system ATP-binding protein